MVKKVICHNDSKNVIYPGGVAIRPGDSRLVDEQYVNKKAVPVFDAEKLVDGNVNDVKKLVEGLALEQLNLLLEAELNGKNRSSLVTRIQSEIEQRQFEQATEIVTNELSEMDIPQLQEMLLNADNSPEDNELIQKILDLKNSSVESDE